MLELHRDTTGMFEDVNWRLRFGIYRRRYNLISSLVSLVINFISVVYRMLIIKIQTADLHYKIAQLCCTMLDRP